MSATMLPDLNLLPAEAIFLRSGLLGNKLTEAGGPNAGVELGGKYGSKVELRLTSFPGHLL